MLRAIVLLVLFSFLQPNAYAQSSETRAALDKLAKTSEELFNSHNAEGWSNLYAEDADVVHSGRKPYASRQEIAAVWAEIFKNNPSLKMKLTNVTRRILTPEIVVESGTVLSDTAAGRSEGKYMAVIQKQEGKWRTVFERSWPAL